MITVEINGTGFFIESGNSVLEACESVGIYIPRFCYQQNLSVAGNCRMCLVEILGSPKPVASCALPSLNNMRICTDSSLVKKARENVLETLLLNHPLDCPICDQAGECDLQDQVKTYGGDRAKYFFNRRAVEDKICNPLIKTLMTRCIHCTRCVRFNSEISGYEFLGALNRGSQTEIGGYSSLTYDSEISANVVDICPVGALTFKQYSFKGRPWELKTYESIDLSDGLGGNVYISTKESEIMRVFPKVNSEINGSIISDRARFYFDSNKINRLESFGGLKSISYPIESNLSSSSLFLLNGSLDLEHLFLFNKIEDTVGTISTIKSFSGDPFSFNFYINWTNSSILEIVKSSTKFCFLVSSNIKVENAIINAKIKIKQSQNDFFVFGFSSNFKGSFILEFINFNLLKFYDILEFRSFYFSQAIICSLQPLFIFSENITKRGVNFFTFFFFLKSILHELILIKIQFSCNLEGAFFLNKSSVVNTRVLKSSNFTFLIDLEESFLQKKILRKKFDKILYFNTHSCELLKNEKNVFLLPCTSEFEEEKFFINLEGRIQKTSKILPSLNKSVLSVKNLLNNFFSIMGPDISKKFLNFFKNIIEYSLLFSYLKEHKIFNTIFLKKFLVVSKSFVLLYPIKYEVEDCYLSNKSSKNSKTLQLCSHSKRKNNYNFCHI